MQSIKFKGRIIQSINPETRQLFVKIANIQSGVSQVSGILDRRILSRRSIGTSLSRAGSSLGKIEQKIKELNSFVNRSVDQYTIAENTVNRKAVSLIATWNKDFGFAQCNNPLNSQSQKSSKVDKKSSSYQEILKYFASANQQMGLLDTALVGSQVASVATAFTLGRKLTINYIGGKPSLWQRLKGGYKFTVSADASWTSKGKYSSNVARYLYDFSKSNPVNPVAKKLHNFVTSYTSPAAILKHAAGFPKNATYMKASTLSEEFHKRIKLGVKDVARNLAEAKGFTKVGKGIPVAGTLISFGSAAWELFDPKNANRSEGEKFGRAVGGFAGDFAAIGGGAKIGAIIGSIGGPVGTVIGGAVGGLAGGLISVKYGDSFKDAGGYIGKLADKGFKSIDSWFN
ncbi:hypothetical protein M3204_04605 [Mesobacillus subterraneus]|uniref:hypothetical protein n=1 Tax=Mesobacillus subterraneus TaxID=285983 RepID=UPI002041E0A5|nr:hypothetical protein [Mesobacillus subterraneus]MCM3663671.1 hypothetical protein [Mesobacillus subterraneus]MCM3683436.1 hypothetical protein [Mesobacillus subterraneus]